MQHPALLIEGLAGRRARAEVQLCVNVVLDQRQLVARDQRDQRALLGRVHGAAQRILEIGHHPGRLRPMAHDRRFHRGQINAVARIGGHFQRMQAVALEHLQAGVETGRLHDHRIAGEAHGRQAQVQPLHRAVGHDDVVRVHAHAVHQVAQRDLPSQRQAAWRQVLGRAPGIEVGGGRRDRTTQPGQRKQERAGKGRAQGHHVAGHGGLKDFEHPFADRDRPRFPVRGGGLFGLTGHPGRGRKHVIARARAGLHQAARLQQVIGLEHGGRAELAVAAGLAHRGQAIAGLEQAPADGGSQVGRQDFVALHGRLPGRLPAPEPAHLICFFTWKLILPPLICRR